MACSGAGKTDRCGLFEVAFQNGAVIAESGAYDPSIEEATESESIFCVLEYAFALSRPSTSATMLIRFFRSLHVSLPQDGSDLPAIKVVKMHDDDQNLPSWVWTFLHSPPARSPRVCPPVIMIRKPWPLESSDVASCI